eukprot:7681197-Pyramimonas_sp.AAC.1
MIGIDLAAAIQDTIIEVHRQVRLRASGGAGRRRQQAAVRPGRGEVPDASGPGLPGEGWSGFDQGEVRPGLR